MDSISDLIIEVGYNKTASKNVKNSKYRSNLVKLYLFNFFIGFSLISGVLIPFYLLYGGFTLIEFIFLQSYYAIMVILFEIPCGVIADYFSKKTSLILASLSYLSIPFIYGIITSKIMFIIGETLFAFSNALISGSNEALVYDNLKQIGKEKYISKSIAKNDGMFLLGLIISAPLGSIIAEFTSIRIVVLLMIFPYLISTIITITIHRINFKNNTNSSNLFETLKSGFDELKKNRILRILIFEKIIIEIIIIFLVLTYQFYIMMEFNIPLFYFGFIDASITVSQFTFLNLIPRLENGIENKRQLLFINTIIPGVGYILIAIINFMPLILLLFLIVIGMGLSRYILFTNGINKQIKKENRATILSTINVLSGILKAILYPLIGLLIMININFLYMLFGVLILIFALKSKIKEDYL